MQKVIIVNLLEPILYYWPTYGGENISSHGPHCIFPFPGKAACSSCIIGSPALDDQDLYRGSHDINAIRKFLHKSALGNMLRNMRQYFHGM